MGIGAGGAFYVGPGGSRTGPIDMGGVLAQSRANYNEVMVADREIGLIYQCVKLALPTAYGVAHHDELMAILAQLEPAPAPDLTWMDGLEGE